jgi:hypothetical protein
VLLPFSQTSHKSRFSDVEYHPAAGALPGQGPTRLGTALAERAQEITGGIDESDPRLNLFETVT